MRARHLLDFNASTKRIATQSLQEPTPLEKERTTAIPILLESAIIPRTTNREALLTLSTSKFTFTFAFLSLSLGADYITNFSRAEDDLSVDSADSFEDPKLRKSRSSRRLRQVFIFFATSNIALTRVTFSNIQRREYNARASRLKKVRPPPVDTRGSKLSDAILVSDNSDHDTRPGQSHRHQPSAKASSRSKQTLELDDENEGARKSASSKSTRKPAAGSQSTPGHRVPKREDSDDGVDSRRDSRKAGPGHRQGPPSSAQPSSSQRQVDKGKVVKTEPVDSDAPIDWPTSPERPPKHRNTAQHDQKKEKSRKVDALTPPIGVDLLPGQDTFLADTYASLEPLK